MRLALQRETINWQYGPSNVTVCVGKQAGPPCISRPAGSTQELNTGANILASPLCLKTVVRPTRGCRLHQGFCCCQLPKPTATLALLLLLLLLLQGWLRTSSPLDDGDVGDLKTCSTSIIFNTGSVPPYTNVPLTQPEHLAMM